MIETLTGFNENSVYYRQCVTFGLRIHVGMDEMHEIVHQAIYRFFGIDEMFKLVMDEMYEIV